MNLNREEIVIASILTALVVPFSYAWLAIPICAFLWALTGSESKWNSKLWRRLVVPMIWAACLIDWKAFLLVPVSYGFLTLGYGLPSHNPPDEGSTIGKFFWRLTNANELWANILTRGVVYVGATIPFIGFRIYG